MDKAETVRIVAGDKEYSGMLLAGKTYVHVRILEEFGLPVHWDGTTKTVYVGEKPQSKLPKLEHLLNCDVIPAKPEQLKVALIKGKLTKDGINGGYFDGSLNPLGVVIVDGKILADRVSHRPPRAVFAIDNAGKAMIIPKVAKAAEISANFALGAGPNLLPVVAQDENFQADIMNSSRPRSAVGITSDGLVKLVATDAMTLQQLSNLMHDLGCVQAMNLDGGGSSQMRFDGKMIRSGDGRSLCTAILLV